MKSYYQVSLTGILTFLLSMCYSDSFADKCKYPGWYRWKEGLSDWCMPCPQGCYCPTAADDKERAPSKWMDCKEGLTKYGIHKCDDGWTTNKVTDILHDRTYEQGAMSSDDCYFVAKDTGKKVKDGHACLEVSAGKYIKAGYEQVQDCKEGYICPGKYLLDSKGNDIRGARAKDAKWDPNTGLSKWKTMCRSPNYDAGIYLCPSGTKANPSHTACVDKEVTVNCKAGQYLPSGKTSCSACKSGNRYYCPGGTFKGPSNHDMGLKIKCEAGQYLPKNSSSCTACKTSNRYYVCAGGTFTTYSSSDLGIKKCTGASVANSDRTACEDANGNTVNAPSSASAIHVPEGQYLPANATEPVSCTGATKYCPGGEFEKASVEQGRFDCPLNGRANSDKTACVVSVSKTWMQYGPLGANTPYKRQCWHQADALDPGRYIACVLSGRYYR